MPAQTRSGAGKKRENSQGAWKVTKSKNNGENQPKISQQLEVFSLGLLGFAT
jgi:hypothetical protein